MKEIPYSDYLNLIPKAETLLDICNPSWRNLDFVAQINLRANVIFHIFNN
jgi:hypothetical protein